MATPVDGPEISRRPYAEPACQVYAVRWPVFEGVYGEGLLLQPRTQPKARVVALPDADQTPEMLAGLAPGIDAGKQFARRLADMGCQVVVPVLIDRADTWSGKDGVAFTNQTHREWVHRQAFELGRSLIGYEVQKVQAVVDWFVRQAAGEAKTPWIGVAGHAEGGLIAFYSAAVDTRIDVALVSGYFDSRQRVWDEPYYRNLFGLLREFGDAEIASLVAPRALIIEHSEVPPIDGPPKAKAGRRAVAAPGQLGTPAFASVRTEVQRARNLAALGDVTNLPLHLVAGPSGSTTGPGSPPALELFVIHLDLAKPSESAGPAPVKHRAKTDPAVRQQRQVQQLVEPGAHSPEDPSGRAGNR